MKAAMSSRELTAERTDGRVTGKKGRRAGVGAGRGTERGREVESPPPSEGEPEQDSEGRSPAGGAACGNATQVFHEAGAADATRLGRSDNPKTERKADTERGRCATQRQIGSLFWGGRIGGDGGQKIGGRQIDWSNPFVYFANGAVTCACGMRMFDSDVFLHF